MIEERAYAKVNLGLRVQNKREDGYHNLDMIMITIDHYDTLLFTENEKIIIESDFDVGDVRDNLIYKAAVLLKDSFQVQKGVKIQLQKKIKVGGGLAGGSSDAAATLRGLNRLWGLKLSVEELKRLALEIGSDVPYCIQGLPALVRGRGELISPFQMKKGLYFVVVCPDYSMSTKEVFSLHKVNNSDGDTILNLRKALIDGKVDNIGPLLINDLEETVFEITKAKGWTTNYEIKTKLFDLGASGAIMSGSGSTIIGVTKAKRKAHKIAKEIAAIYPNFEIFISKNR